MGRYYNGDIEGKFWFGVQSSSAADRFGVTGHQPEILEYYFDEENLETIEEELSTILESLNGFKDKLDELTPYLDHVLNSMKHKSVLASKRNLQYRYKEIDRNHARI